MFLKKKYTGGIDDGHPNNCTVDRMKHGCLIYNGILSNQIPTIMAMERDLNDISKC